MPAIASADTGDPLAYYGGPVAHSMTGVLVDWGHDINPIYTDPTSGDPGLLKYLASQSGTPNGIGGVLAQYLDTSGANSANQVTFGGQFAITPSTTATTLEDAQVGSELIAQIGSGALPAPAGNGLTTDYLVLFPAGTTVCDSDGCSGQAFCSYHGSTQLADGTYVLYDVLPDNTTGPMTQGCGEQSPIRNQTMYLSHEWAETIDDPLVDDASSLAPPLSWYDSNCPTASSLCGEVADKCNQEPTLEGDWTVQLLWSNLDHACVGTEYLYGTPSTSFTVPGSAAPGAPLTFVASASDPPDNSASATWQGQQYAIAAGIASLVWSWGDGTPPASGSQAIHTFATPGIYDVTLTATDNLGFTGQATQAIGVWGPQGPPLAQTGVATSVKPASAILTGTIDAAGTSAGYRFEYGTTESDLVERTRLVPGPSGAAPVAVTAAVLKLSPSTTYYDRLDAVIDGHAIPGAVGSFRTPGAAKRASAVARLASAGSRRRRRREQRHVAPRRNLRPVPVRLGPRAVVARVSQGATATPVEAGVLGKQVLASALRRGLAVSFRCPGPCNVALQATLQLRGAPAAVSVARVLARGSGRATRRDGRGTARLRFSSSARAWLSRLPGATFAVAGFIR